MGDGGTGLPDGVLELARRLGVPDGQVFEVAGGVANRGFVLGKELFLRIARPGFEGDLRKEAAVVPVARAAGVLTPAIIEYDESLDLIAAPYVVMERLAERGYLDRGTAKWLDGWFTRLADRFDRDDPKVLIHGDVAAHNLLAGPDGELSALIDWGDAAWAPRAMDFAKLPLDHVAAILPDYVHHHNALSTTHRRTHEEELAAATLWFHLAWALGKLAADPWPGQRHWTAPPGSRLLGLLRFFASAPPSPWSNLT